MNVRWITSSLGTGPFSDNENTTGTTIIDVRDLVDKAGNEKEAVLRKIKQAIDVLEKGEKVVVCCDYGMSRSNAVAAGILSCFEKRDFDNSLRKVLKATGERQVKLGPLTAVRAALGLETQKKSPTAKRSILITGGSGFLGRVLQSAIKEDCHVFAPSRSEVDLTEGSTMLDLFVAEKCVDCVVHLANPRVYTSNTAIGQTLTMLRNVIDVCLSRDIPLIYSSCSEVYSGHKGLLRADNATPLLPEGPYGETKYLAEILIEHCVRTAGLRCALIRSSHVYGRGGDRPKFIYNFIEKALQSIPIMTHRYRNGEPELDLLYVDDLIAALVMVIKSGYTGKLNLGTGVLTSTRQIAQLIVEKLGSRSLIKQHHIDAEAACIAIDWRWAQKEIGWEPRIPFDEGIDLLISDIRNERNNGNG